MRRRPVPILVISAVLAGVAAESVEARTKSFCRRWAAGVANNNILYERGAAQEAAGPRERVVASKAGTAAAPSPASKEALGGGGLGGTLMRLTKPPRWHEIYDKAYAHCRVVEVD